MRAAARVLEPCRHSPSALRACFPFPTRKDCCFCSTKLLRSSFSSNPRLGFPFSLVCPPRSSQLPRGPRSTAWKQLLLSARPVTRTRSPLFPCHKPTFPTKPPTLKLFSQKQIKALRVRGLTTDSAARFPDLFLKNPAMLLYTWFQWLLGRLHWSIFSSPSTASYFGPTNNSEEDQGLKHQLKLVMQQLSCVEKLAWRGTGMPPWWD